MVRSKDLSEAFRKKIVAAYESGKGFKKISKKIRKIVYKWRTFKTTASMPRSGHPSKFTPRADRKMLKEVPKTPKMHQFGEIQQ
uniref:Transposase n=1 Tax=Dicentrarchus labrax TaxID=13489 RepID=A0A8P4GBZ8_DICLA